MNIQIHPTTKVVGFLWQIRYKMKQHTKKLTAILFLIALVATFFILNALELNKNSNSIYELKEQVVKLELDLGSKQKQIEDIQDQMRVANARALYKERSYNFWFSENSKESIRNNF